MNLQEGFVTTVPQYYMNARLTFKKKQEEVIQVIMRPIMRAFRINSERGKTKMKGK